VLLEVGFVDDSWLRKVDRRAYQSSICRGNAIGIEEFPSSSTCAALGMKLSYCVNAVW
jgi:hypothetical protein